MTNNLAARGPWRLTPDSALDPGESAVFDLFNEKHNGRKSFFKPHLPLDEAQITNESTDNALVATFNGVHETYVVPNSVSSFDDAGITRIVVTNDGSTTVSADSVTLVVAKTAYDADDAAREQKGKSTAQRALSALSGGVL